MNLDLNCVSCVLRMRPSPLPNLFLVDVMVNDFKPLDYVLVQMVALRPQMTKVCTDLSRNSLQSCTVMVLSFVFLMSSM